MSPVTFRNLLDEHAYHKENEWIRKYYKGRSLGFRAKKRWLLENLPNPDHISIRWKDVSEDAHFLWGVIAGLGGCATKQRLTNFFRGSGVAVVDERGTVMLGGRTLSDLLEALYDAALVIKYGSEGYYYPDYYRYEGNLWVIPESVLLTLKKSEMPEVLSRLKEPGESVRSLSPDMKMFQKDALFFWGNAWRNPMKLLVSAHISKRDFQTIRPFLHGVEPDATSGKDSFYVRFLHSLLISTGLLKEEGGLLYASLTAGRPHRFWSLSSLKRFNNMWKSLWNVDWRYVSGKPLGDLIFFLKAPRESERKWVKRLLEFVKEKLVGMDPGEKVSLQLLWLWMIESSNIQVCARVKKESGLDRIPYWLRTGDEERALVESIARALYRIGVADLLSKAGQIAGVSISSAGQNLLKGISPAEEPPARPVVQPNFQVLAIGPVPLGDLALLEMIGERVKAEKAVVEYKLDRMIFLHSLAGGLDGEYALSHLEEIAGAGIPQNVRRSLTEWLDEFEKATIYRGGILVEAQTPAMLNRLLSTVSKKSVVRLGETQALVPAALREHLEKAMLRYGILPDVIEDPSAVDGSIEVDADGRIRSRFPFPSLYVVGRLNKLAEPQPDGTWLLTRESLRKAARHMSAKEILEILRKMNGRPLPKEIETRVLIWSGFFGNVRVMRVTLIQFRDSDALKAARKLPGLSRALKEFPYAPGKGLAVVHDDKLQEIISRLEEHGIQVEVVSGI